ncbi:glycosyl hydrolase family 28 protein [Micromonospora sp. SL1-18]|uniref:glycosyl hydrolase family 28 protein n=1 Tax=Micromonospora sp. SL1-18 TaxID=3399128 RepID=UPI003A4E15F0
MAAATLVSSGVAQGAAATTEPYRSLPGASESTDYRVSVDGQPVFVNAYKDIAYASFAFDKPVSITVSRVSGLLVGAKLLPEGAGTASYSPDAVTVALADPANLVLTLPKGPRLFLFADSLSKNPGAPSGAKVWNVVDLGVDPAGDSVQTAQIQQAIDTVAGQGGGTVYFPPGRYLTGTLAMRSQVTLYLADGAVIQGTSNPADYPVDPGRTEVGTDGRIMTFSRLIYFDNVQNAGIAGRGVIDGDGKKLRQAGRAANLIRVVNSSNVQISNVVLRDSAAWNTHILNSRNVLVNNVRIINDMTNPNTDGVDVDSSSKVTVDRLFAYTGDDSFVAKATDNSDLLADPHDLTVSNSVLLTLKTALKLGTESRSAQFYGIRFAGNTVVTADRAFGLVARDGAAFRDISYDGIDVHDVAHLLSQDLSPRAGQNVAGSLSNVTFRNVRVTDYHPSSNSTNDNKTPYAFHGYDAQHQVTGLAFKDVFVNGRLLTDYVAAARVAMLSFGPYVQDVAFSHTGPAPAPVSVELAPIGTLKAGEAAPVSATFTNQAASGQPIKNLVLSLRAPYDWGVEQVAGPTTATVQPGEQVEVTWNVTPPGGFFGGATLYAVATYVDPSGNRQLEVPSDGGAVAVATDLVRNVVPDKLAGTGMAQAGAQYLVDRDYTISTLPSALAGGVLVPGANADKSATSPARYLTFDVNRDATVYVCFEARGEGDWWPAWLTDGFQHTNLTVTTTSGTTYAVLARQVPSGEVVLGPNAGRSGVSGNNSYFTIVMPR